MRTALFGLEKAGILFDIPAFFLHVVFEAYAAELFPVSTVLSFDFSFSFGVSFISGFCPFFVYSDNLYAFTLSIALIAICHLSVRMSYSGFTPSSFGVYMSGAPSVSGSFSSSILLTFVRIFAPPSAPAEPIFGVWISVNPYFLFRSASLSRLFCTRLRFHRHTH